jgi:Ca2+-dependent lipid-binding protein
VKLFQNSEIMGEGKITPKACRHLQKQRPKATGQNLRDGNPNAGLSTSRKEHIALKPGDSKEDAENSVPESSRQQSSIQQPTTPSSVGEEPAVALDEVADRPRPGFSRPDAVPRAKEDWEYQKSSWNMSNTALDLLMEMIGLEDVKAKFVEINTLIATAVRQKVGYSKEKFGAVFIGNPGTGQSPFPTLVDVV